MHTCGEMYVDTKKKKDFFVLQLNYEITCFAMLTCSMWLNLVSATPHMLLLPWLPLPMLAAPPFKVPFTLLDAKCAAAAVCERKYELKSPLAMNSKSRHIGLPMAHTPNKRTIFGWSNSASNEASRSKSLLRSSLASSLSILTATMEKSPAWSPVTSPGALAWKTLPKAPCPMSLR